MGTTCRSAWGLQRRFGYVGSVANSRGDGDAVSARRPAAAAEPHCPAGGTNDLGWNAQPAEILRNLVKMYELARASQVMPIPVTVPTIRVDAAGGGPDAEALIGQHLSGRAELNGLIQEYAVSKDLPWIDLFMATAESTTGQLAAQYSNDGLHLTTSGYRLLAQLLYDQIFAKAFQKAQE